MVFSYRKICFLVLLNLIFKNKGFSQTLNTNPGQESESTAHSKSLSPDLVNSLKQRLNNFGAFGVTKTSDENKESSGHSDSAEPEIVPERAPVPTTSEHEATEHKDPEPNESEAKPSYLESVLSQKRPEQVTRTEYKPRQWDFDIPSHFDYFITNEKRAALKKCTKTPHEFVLIIDESGSISSYNWNTKVKDFVLLVTSAIAQVNSNNKVSIIQYSHTPRLIMDSTKIDKLTFTGATKIIDNMFSAPRTHGTTYTGSALEFARTRVLDKHNEFVVGLSERVEPIEKKNQIIILFTDGGSKDPEKALRESLIHRFNGVDLFVFGIGSFNESECRKLVGCSPRGDCNNFIHARWDSVLEYLQNLVISMCRDTGRNATCLEKWSEFSECSAKCGGGITKSTLLKVVTVAPPTTGEDGIKGLTCEEQYRNVSERFERCNTFPCTDNLVNINEHSGTYDHDDIPYIDPQDDYNPEDGEEVSDGMKTVNIGERDRYDGGGYGDRGRYSGRGEAKVTKERTENLHTHKRPTSGPEGTALFRDESPRTTPREDLPSRGPVSTPIEEVPSPIPDRSTGDDNRPTASDERSPPSDNRPKTREEAPVPVEGRANPREDRDAESTDERDNRRLNEVLRDIESSQDLRHFNSQPEVSHRQQTPARHSPPSRDHGTHSTHGREYARGHHETHGTDTGARDTPPPNLTNLGEFDGPGRVPFHLLNQSDHNGAHVDRVLNEDEVSQLKSSTLSSQSTHATTNPRNMRDHDSQTEAAGETDNLQDRQVHNRDFSTNTENAVNSRDFSTNTENAVNTREFSTNTENAVNTREFSTNTENAIARDIGTNTENTATATKDSSANTESATQPPSESEEAIKKHEPKVQNPGDHHPHHTTESAGERPHSVLFSTKMKFKRFFENENIRKLAAVAIVIFLSALSIYVFSYIFLREKEPTPHLFDPSDQEFMNAGDGDDVEPSENYQVSNMEDGIWA